MAFSPDGKTLASGLEDKSVRLWEVASGRAQRTLEGHQGYVSAVAFSPDGKTLASGSADNSVRLWDVATGECIAILYHFPNGGWAILTPDNYFMADPIGKRHLTFADEDLALFPASKMPHLENEQKVRQALARVFGPAL